MENLVLFERGLIPVYKTDTGEYVVNGRELWEGLQSKRQFADWVKSKLSDCEAVESEDFETVSQNCENGGKRIEYIIKLDTAKEMAMLERNEIGKRVRKYFIEIEKKHNAPKSQAEILLGQAQMLVDMECKQKQQDIRVTALEDNQKAIQQAVAKPVEYDFKQWVKKCLDAIAQSPKYVFVGDNAFQAARRESYDRLNNKRPSMLETRVKNAKRIARENGATETMVEKINKLTVIANSKDLKPVYESVIREMMIVYCVKVA